MKIWYSYSCCKLSACLVLMRAGLNYIIKTCPIFLTDCSTQLTSVQREPRRSAGLSTIRVDTLSRSHALPLHPCTPAPVDAASAHCQRRLESALPSVAPCPWRITSRTRSRAARLSELRNAKALGVYSQRRGAWAIACDSSHLRLACQDPHHGADRSYPQPPLVSNMYVPVFPADFLSMHPTTYQRNLLRTPRSLPPSLLPPIARIEYSIHTYHPCDSHKASGG